MYRLHRREPPAPKAQVRLLGSGAILREVIAARNCWPRDWNVASDVYSVTSFSELARDAREVERWNRLHPGSAAKPQPRRRRARRARLRSSPRPTTCARIRNSSPPTRRARFVALGTDGFGRSDTRAALRHFFEVDRHQVVIAALGCPFARARCRRRRRRTRYPPIRDRHGMRAAVAVLGILAPRAAAGCG